MQAEERQKTIMELLHARQQVMISDLSARFGVSEMTVRRDLMQLEKEGLIRRTHGGAVPTDSSSFEPPFALRARTHADAKRAIAAEVARELRDGQTLVLDGGSTGTAIAEALVGRNLTVCALSMRVAEILASSAATRVMIPGGQIRHGELSIIGPAAARTLADHRFDTYVMTVSGVDTAAGLTEWNVDDAAVKRAALDASASCVLACDSSKFGKIAFARVAALSAVDTVITDAGLTPDQRQAVESDSTTLRIA
ncbi:DeoR/GlpR family DNA-binding transcription regulator [Streptomyces sparsogenes]|uniref:DeoR/GlpR family DNA-binding transcription regulator n=1 Tax=Streptomyces sparsogenes TaxID=67365 RepID=UPI0033F12522